MAKSWFIRYAFVCVFSATLLLFGCTPNTPVGKAPPSPLTDIQNTNQDIANTVTKLTDTTNKIKQDATDGTKAAPAAAATWQDILTQCGFQQGLIDGLKQDQLHLLSAATKTQTLEGDYNTEHAARLKAESSATKALQAKFIWASMACFGLLVVGIGVVVIGTAEGNKMLSNIATGAAVCAGIGLAISIALIETVALIPWIVGGAILVCGGIVVYRIVIQKKTIATVTTAVATAATKLQGLKDENQKLTSTATELVHTVEASKVFMTANARKAVFGDGPVPAIAHILQSPDTRLFVNAARLKMPNVAPNVTQNVAPDVTSSVHQDPQVNPQTDAIYIPRTVNGKSTVIVVE